MTLSTAIAKAEAKRAEKAVTVARNVDEYLRLPVFDPKHDVRYCEEYGMGECNKKHLR